MKEGAQVKGAQVICSALNLFFGMTKLLSKLGSVPT